MINVIGNKLDARLDNDPSMTGDLPSWNEYVGTWNDSARTLLPQKLDAINTALKGKPLFISEAGLCEPAFSGGDARRIDDMHYHLHEWRKKPFIAGFVYFCLNDYRTQMGEEGLGRFQLRRHGVTDIYLRPKPSYYTFAHACSPIEITKVTRISATDISIELSVKNHIPSYTIRNYRLVYKDITGKLQHATIDIMKPGDRRQFVLKNINERYAFDVQRPGGEIAVKY